MKWVLESVKLQKYNFHLICKTHACDMNVKAPRRKCPICQKIFQPRAYEKFMRRDDKDEAIKSISFTMEILGCIYNHSVDYNLGKDEELSFVLSEGGDIDLSDISDVFATDDSQNVDTNRKSRTSVEKQQFFKELSENMRLRQTLLPSIVQNKTCHICHLRRPTLIAFGCGGKHFFCERHATSRLVKQDSTLEEIVSSFKHCPICCFECICSKCERDRESKWRGRSKSRASPKLISDNDQETVKDFFSCAAFEGSRNIDEENKAVTMPKQCLAHDEKKAEIAEGYEIIDLLSVDDEVKSESNVTRAADNNNGGEDFPSWDKIFSSMYVSKEHLFSEVSNVHDQLKEVRKQREEHSVKIRESTERCNNLKEKWDDLRVKLKDGKLSSGTYFISNESQLLHKFHGYPQFWNSMLEEHEKHYMDELKFLEALKKDESLVSHQKDLEQRCNHLKKRLHSFTVECVQCCSAWGMETPQFGTKYMNPWRKEGISHTLSKSPQTVARALSTEDDDSSMQSLTTQSSFPTMLKKRRMPGSRPTLNDPETAAIAVSNLKSDDVSVIVID